MTWRTPRDFFVPEVAQASGLVVAFERAADDDLGRVIADLGFVANRIRLLVAGQLEADPALVARLDQCQPGWRDRVRPSVIKSNKES